ncbi:hypothetical protein [Sphaerochaeta sp. PS]|uniref:hypothetical protein n=1 Tax=Sphaerochaeta sp. PS TaxID=3076336 RepID=UPI0028A40BBE|nr:hypothetical protein [Sphaerochaeta sp. PS]MDT4761900.1 hypothetical protein [Sphaerochaeta sp. PS]
MKKRLIVLLIVVCVLLPATLSAAMVDLSIGATALYNQTFTQMQTAFDAEDYTGFSTFENYAFGADVRMKILLAEVDLVGMFGQETIGGTDYTTISVLTAGGISLDILNFARLGFAMGPRFNVYIDSATGEAQVKDSNNVLVDWNNFGDAFLKSPVAYRATVDFDLGGLMLGLNYTVDTLYTFENWDKVQDLFDADPNGGKVGISLLFSLL